ncbi:MAG: hypothetical protein DRH12_05690 [Deltaproteobacteria bacterium]|nr:MAG: hypothetical protein DRH12_05690 [Deltaproteobacteria bacterium]
MVRTRVRAGLTFALDSSGFTLLEIIVGAMLLAAIAAIVIPAFSSWLPRYHLKAASQDLFGSLQLAKASAIEQGCICTVSFGQPIDSRVYDYVVFLDLDNDLEYDNDEEILVKRSWGGREFPGISFDPGKGGGDGLTFPHNDDGLPAIGFKPSGIPVNNSGGLGMGSAYLVNGKGQGMRVVVSASGNIRVK